MPPTKKPDRLRAKHAFGVSYEGEIIQIAKGEVVRVGHPLLDSLGRNAVTEHFEPVQSFGRWDVDVEQATAAPGERRG
jgi:hypothetical protein